MLDEPLLDDELLDEEFPDDELLDEDFPDDELPLDEELPPVNTEHFLDVFFMP